MLSGDGNFHLQSLSHVDNEHVNPSVFGDFGFWVPYEIAKKYTEWADSNKNYAHVRRYDWQCNLALNYTSRNLVLVILRQGLLLRSDRAKISE